MANAAAATALPVKRFEPHAVLNQGTSGGHAPDFCIAEILSIGEQVHQYDRCALPPNRERGGMIEYKSAEPLGLEVPMSMREMAKK